MATLPTAGVPALTTTFTPAPSCLRDVYLLDWNKRDSGSCTAGTSTFNCRYLHLGPPANTNCQPQGWKPTTSMFFSPGVCPSGYREACTHVLTVGSVTETRATCCPSEYKCIATTETGRPWYSLNGCTYVVPTPSRYTYITSEPTGLTTSTAVAPFGVNANAVYIRYQSTDLIAATANPEPSQSTPSSSTSSSSSPTLSSGAKAGIGVGVALGAILLLVCAFFLLRRRRGVNSQPQKWSDQAPKRSDKVEMLELPGAASAHAHEMSNDDQIFEAGDSSRTQGSQTSAHKQQEPVELPAGHE